MGLGDHRRKILCITRRNPLEVLVSTTARSLKLAPPTFLYRFHEMVDWLQQQKGGVIVVIDSMHNDRGMSWVDFVQRTAWETLALPSSLLMVIAPEFTHVHFAVASEYYVSKMVMERQTTPEQLLFNLNSILEKQNQPDLLTTMLFEVQKSRRSFDFEALDKATLLVHQHFPKVVRARVEYADYCIRNDDIASAEAIISSLTAEHPNLVQTIMLNARLSILHGDFAAAEKLLCKAEDMSPRNFERLLLLAKITATSAHAQKSLEMLRTAISIRGDHKLPYVEICRVISLYGELDELNENLEKLDDADVVRTLNASAVDLLKENNLPRAEKIFEIAMTHVEDVETRARLRYNLAVGFVKAGAYEKAETLLRDILDSVPEFEKAKTVLAKLRSRASSGG
jgi:tetratricopeptide (TPR) repeat protein